MRINGPLLVDILFKLEDELKDVRGVSTREIFKDRDNIDEILYHVALLYDLNYIKVGRKIRKDGGRKIIVDYIIIRMTYEGHVYLEKMCIKESIQKPERKIPEYPETPEMTWGLGPGGG